MQIGITGLAGAGKTTVFNVLARSHAQVGAFSAQPHVAVVKVPDPRLDPLAELFHPERVVPAEVQYVDVAGVVPGGDRDRSAQILANLREADVLLQVVRAFGGAARGEPERDLADLHLEFVFADLGIIQRKLERLEKEVRLGKLPVAERQAQQRELEVLTQLREALGQERPIRDLDIEPEDEKLLRGYGFLTGKPLLILANVEEPGSESDALAQALADHSPHRSTEALALAGRLEMELMDLEPDEAAEFMGELGIAASGLDRVIQTSYRLASLISFFTVGQDEVRAWTVPSGTTAVPAAGVIHSDLARGFIRAEVINWQDLVDAGGLTEARRRGQLRSEGKNYVLADGDVFHVLFNV